MLKWLAKKSKIIQLENYFSDAIKCFIYSNYEVKQIKMSGMTAIAITTTNQSNANQQSDISLLLF